MEYEVPHCNCKQENMYDGNPSEFAQGNNESVWSGKNSDSSCVDERPERRVAHCCPRLKTGEFATSNKLQRKLRTSQSHFLLRGLASKKGWNK